MDIRKAKQALNIQQWKAIIEDRNGSGLIVAEYCRQNVLSRDSYFYWLRIIRKKNLQVQGQLSFDPDQPNVFNKAEILTENGIPDEPDVEKKVREVLGVWL